MVSEAEDTPLALITGSVTDSNGRPLQGVTILAVNSSSDQSVATVSNESGIFRLIVPSGTYNISAGLANYSSDRSYINAVVPGAELTYYNFTMTEVLCTFTGYVSAGTPVFGAKITLSNSLYNYTTYSVSGFGRFVISNAQPGVYVAYAEKYGYSTDYTKDNPITLIRGTTVERNFTLELQAAQVYGTVTNENGKILSNVMVVLTSSDGTTGLIRSTDSYGNYSFSSLATNNYTLTFSLDGYQTKTQQIALDPYAAVKIDASLSFTKVNTTTVLFGYDLNHSLMVIAFMTGLVVVIAGVYLSIRSQRKPELLARVSDDERDDRPKE